MSAILNYKNGEKKLINSVELFQLLSKLVSRPLKSATVDYKNKRCTLKSLKRDLEYACEFFDPETSVVEFINYECKDFDEKDIENIEVIEKVHYKHPKDSENRDRRRESLDLPDQMWYYGMIDHLEEILIKPKVYEMKDIMEIFYKFTDDWINYYNYTDLLYDNSGDLYEPYKSLYSNFTQ